MSSSDFGMFYREDLSRPENRINVALFGVLGIEAFQTAFLSALGLEQEALVFPPANTVGSSGSIRPDFGVKVGETMTAWIEVELGSDAKQLARYRTDLPEPVLAIWGSSAPGVAMTLHDLVEIATKARTRSSRQQALQLDHFVGLVEGLQVGGYQRRTAVSDVMRESPFYSAFDSAVGGIRPLSDYNPRGSVYSDTVSANGFSIRVASAPSRTGGGTVSLFNRTAGRAYLQFNGRSHLRRYLPNRLAEIDAIAEFVATLGAELDADRQPGRRVELANAEQHVPELAGLVRALAR